MKIKKENRSKSKKIIKNKEDRKTKKEMIEKNSHAAATVIGWPTITLARDEPPSDKGVEIATTAWLRPTYTETQARLASGVTTNGNAQLASCILVYFSSLFFTRSLFLFIFFKTF